MTDMMRHIFCDRGGEKFSFLDTQKGHFIVFTEILCIFNCLFELGTFFGWLMELSTLLLITTGKRFLQMHYLNHNK